MGLSIHYSGSIDLHRIDDFIDEAKDICSSLGWKYNLIDSAQAKGIAFGPKNCEPVFFIFDPDGHLRSATYFILNDLSERSYTISTKTQFAGIEAHKAVIKLVRYLSEKYLNDFHLTDEGGYWETGNEAELQKHFDNYNSMLDLVVNAFSNAGFSNTDPAESITDRIERILTEKWKQWKAGQARK